ncbi:TMhelix containing protein [Vibrio phage 1.238.A._10N.261.52.F10]|uniref:TMhelix containing protein n=2 Tax=Pariacacavirus TaxID=2948856 RepID=A0A2I7RUH1_9CAUD|nr:TMhelix containing protein [Vibrio phage 1.238.A._10N.261.52.F10]YP_010093491.1 TMhelix containing protein [Vibrio phage 1.245.O._10N.261.54.C7]AUR97293.1 TMhelix containing protein [Vibrio phage 1.238.A._10N.261.52.F10]AUR97387.1 TMhelix containing protein [Vibrio phage 1.238.B._10N.261.52.F10]AUR97961.1 TMhelix containing protein [Vibrio phage 1.245.O._10N.261.54.C7]
MELLREVVSVLADVSMIVLLITLHKRLKTLEAK